MVSSVINQLGSFQFLDVSPLVQRALSVLRTELLEEDMDGIRSSRQHGEDYHRSTDCICVHFLSHLCG